MDIKKDEARVHEGMKCVIDFNLLQVTRQKNNYSFMTLDLMKMNDRCDEALKEIFHMSYMWAFTTYTLLYINNTGFISAV